MQVKQAILTVLVVSHQELPLEPLQDCSSFMLRAWQFKQQSSNSVMFLSYSCIEIDIFLLSYRWYNSKKKINLSKRDLIFFFNKNITQDWYISLESPIVIWFFGISACEIIAG